jgi:hypothetical protein
MSITESQLEIWAKQGSITQSQQTYATVRNCLEADDAPYCDKSFSIFLQGSYGNDTNIFADSDVDVVITTSSIYYYDDSELPDDQKAAFHAALGSGGGYTYDKFKADVTMQLTRKFGASVKPSRRAIFVESSGARRDADVLAAVQHRRYTKYNNIHDNQYYEGICFWTTDGTKIINYPKYHSENCTTKHQGANSWFKPCVRILKNMRNSMIDSGYLAEGIAPSYFLEGMLYNVPNNQFGGTYLQTIANALNWIKDTDRSKLVCANERYMLLHPTSPVTWRADHLQTYITAAIKFWNDW